MFSNFARFAHAHLWLIGLAALGVGQSRSQGPRSFWSATGIGPHCPFHWTKQRGLWERDWALAKNNNAIDRKWNCTSLATREIDGKIGHSPGLYPLCWPPSYARAVWAGHAIVLFQGWRRLREETKRCQGSRFIYFTLITQKWHYIQKTYNGK